MVKVFLKIHTFLTLGWIPLMLALLLDVGPKFYQVLPPAGSVTLMSQSHVLGKLMFFRLDVLVKVLLKTHISGFF